MKDNNDYLINAAIIDTVRKTFNHRPSGTYVYLEIQVGGIKHTLSYDKDEALRDADYERLKQSGQH